MPSEKVERTFIRIANLTLDELNELRDMILREWGDDWGLSGMREPRRPNEPPGEATVELEEPHVP
jgi:hypothetical protein